MIGRRTSRAELIERLREGPLPLDEWPEIATSREALKVRIVQLRSRGYTIHAERLPRPAGHYGRGPVTYRLVTEPIADAAKSDFHQPATGEPNG